MPTFRISVAFSAKSNLKETSPYHIPTPNAIVFVSNSKTVDRWLTV